jgi:hypothetical protein
MGNAVCGAGPEAVVVVVVGGGDATVVVVVGAGTLNVVVVVGAGALTVVVVVGAVITAVVPVVGDDAGVVVEPLCDFPLVVFFANLARLVTDPRANGLVFVMVRVTLCLPVEASVARALSAPRSKGLTEGEAGADEW